MRTDEQTGFLFFQPATPRTGVQKDLPDFFDQDAAEKIEIGLGPKVIFGVGGLLFLWLLVSLIFL